MTKTQHRILSVLSGLLLVVALASAGLSQTNASLRRQVAERQQYLQQSTQLEGLYREMVRTLAELSARHGDESLRALLQRHGITYNVNAAAPAAAGPSAARK